MQFLSEDTEHIRKKCHSLLYVHGASQGQGASCCGDAEGTRAVWVPACPRSPLDVSLLPYLNDH